jgi:hypothetical protein
MSICVLVMTDGRRECLARTLVSLREKLAGPVTRRVIHDDSGDIEFQAWVRQQDPDFELISTGTRSGFGGAYRNAWRWVAENVDQPFLFSTEDDFVMQRRVDLRAMRDVLQAAPDVAQVALRRQAWNPAEIEAGGVVEQHPGDYADAKIAGWPVLLHRRFWTTNPSLHRTSMCRSGWPGDPRSEGLHTARLLRDSATRFAYWGSRDSGVWAEHIGHERVGRGY